MIVPGSPSSKVRWSRPKDSTTEVAVEREHPPRRLRVGDRQQVLALGQALAGAQVERHPLPAPVVDEGLDRDEGLGVGVGGDPVLLAVAAVLAADHVLDPQRRHRVEDLLALDPERLWPQRGRRLHRDEAEHLEQMRDDHVAEGARFLIEAAPHLDRERLGDVDLDVVDVVAVPDRLEHAVGEAHRQQVLHRLATQVVVDPENPLLVEDRLQQRVQLARRGEVGAERLLGDHPRAGAEPELADRLDRLLERLRRQREVEEHARPPRPVRGAPRRSPRRAARARRRRRRSAATKRNSSSASPSSLRRPEPQTASRATSRNSSALIPCRAAPMIRKRSGISPTSVRWNIPGSSLRLARSPVAPKRTITWSSGRSGAASPAAGLVAVTLTSPG